ncbi:MAG: GC-type dockerin domain-anchored protein [Phycisphaerales bacterium]
MPRRSALTPVLLLATCSTAFGIERTAAEQLSNAFPGVRFHHEQQRLQYVYGVPMTAGADARAAANQWIASYGEVFNCGVLSVREDWVTPTIDNNHTIFTFQQYIGGVPVEFGMLKVMVLSGPTPRVVYAAGTLAPAPTSGEFPSPTVSAEAAFALIQSQAAWKGLSSWSKPTLVIWQGNGDWVSPVLTWKFTGENPDPATTACRTFFVDALTGALVATRNEVLHTDVAGTVKGRGSPGFLPDVAYNPPVLLNVPNMRVEITGGNTAFTTPLGAFSILNPGTTPVTVTCGVATAAGAGQWCNVNSSFAGAANLTASVSATPPGPADLVLNTTPSEHLTSQVNGFVCTTLSHNYFRDRAPAFTGIDHALRCNTSVSGSCNATFSPGATPPASSAINMFRAGSGCVNMGYSTIVSHEYGHFIVNRLNRAQNAFGEGFGDMIGSMVWDDRVSGRDVFGQGTVGRDPIASNVQYPCGGPIHTCGMVLSGVWWRTRTNMGTVYGSGPGLDLTRNLNVKWALLTLGGPNSANAAGPATAIEVLTADDNDGSLDNGTPNYASICPAFAAHGITCPAITQNPCYANCDGSTTPPILNVNDFTCFTNLFAAGSSLANCDGSTTPPVLNVNDFTCFLNRFAAGCT